MKPEQKIKSQIRTYLRSVPSCYTFHYSAYLGEPGIPDYIGVYRGLFIGIEVKCPGKPLTENQELKIQILKNCGGHVIMATCVQDVKDFINNLKENTTNE